MGVETTNIYIKAIQLVKLVTRCASNYAQRYKYLIGGESTRYAVELLKQISLGLEFRAVSKKINAFDRAKDALISLKVELVVANELDILSVENKARIDIIVDEVEGQLRAVANSVKRTEIGSE